MMSNVIQIRDYEREKAKDGRKLGDDVDIAKSNLPDIRTASKSGNRRLCGDFYVIAVCGKVGLNNGDWGA